MTHFHDSTHISGFVLDIDQGDRLIGPFDTPDLAGAWAVDHLGAQYRWVIRPLADPNAEKD